jgi:hypothetical protein
MNLQNVNSTYIDYIHNTFLSKLFDVKVELDKIKYIKRSSYDNHIFNFRIWVYELYYDFFLNIDLFFPYYDLYNIFSFLF